MEASIAELGIVQSPMVCLICLNSPEYGTEQHDFPAIPEDDVTPPHKVLGNIILDHTDRPLLHVLTPYEPHPVECAHVYVSEQEYLAGVNQRLLDRIEQAKQEAADKRKRAAKASRWFPNAAKDRMDSAFLAIKANERWCMENPPRMATLKYIGSGRKRREGSNETIWLDYAKSYEMVAAHLKRFAAIFELAYGIPFDAMRVLEFATLGYNPHFHLLFSVPLDSFGFEARANFKPNSVYYKKFHGWRFPQFMELVWAEITGQKADISSPTGKGHVTWLPTAAEVPKADSIQEYVHRFIDYSRKSGKNAGKITQHRVAYQWGEQQVNFWGILGFQGLRRAASEPLVLECRTKAALLAAMHYVRRLDGVNPKYKAMEAEDGSETLVDISPLSPELTRLQGGRSRSRRTAKELTVLRRLVDYYNSVGPEVRAAVSNPAGGPVWEEYEYEEMTRVGLILAAADATDIPAWWEREGADVYLSNMMAEMETQAY